MSHTICMLCVHVDHVVLVTLRLKLSVLEYQCYKRPAFRTFDGNCKHYQTVQLSFLSVSLTCPYTGAVTLFSIPQVQCNISFRIRETCASAP